MQIRGQSFETDVFRNLVSQKQSTYLLIPNHTSAMKHYGPQFYNQLNPVVFPVHTTSLH